MATYPIRMLKDETGQPFVPICGTNSIVYDDRTTLQEKLDQKIGSDNLIAGNAIKIEKEGINLVVSADLPDMTAIENNLTTLNNDVSTLKNTTSSLDGSIKSINTNITTLTNTDTSLQNQIDTANTNIAKKLEVSNIKAGNNVTVTNSGNNVTIAAVVPTPATNYYGISVPANSLGKDGDLYILIESE